MDIIIKLLAVFGAFVLAGIVIGALSILVQNLKEFIERKKYDRMRKHRFDKPPVAKCFCKDCKYWRQSDGLCYHFEEWHTADCWFCWNAEPLTLEEHKRREL